MTLDATQEKTLDRRVQQRLSTDSAYRNAENAEEQSQREWVIEHEEYVRLMDETAGCGGCENDEHCGICACC